jgi:hypothetical protein
VAIAPILGAIAIFALMSLVRRREPEGISVPAT